MAFPEKVRTKVLLWCDRHCCWCKKACGVNIEVHHIIQGGGEDVDNAIPLCLDCHGRVQHYNDGHPIGTKYKPEEIRARREQVYEEFTRHLVPPIDFQITQRVRTPQGATGERQFPDVGFTLSHLGDSLPVRVFITVQIKLGETSLGFPEVEYYSGEKPWHMNPRRAFFGHFKVPAEAVESDERLEARVVAKVIDCYEREHTLLPVGFVYMREENSWYAEP